MSASFLIFLHYRISQSKSKGIPEKNRLRALAAMRHGEARGSGRGDFGRRSRRASD